MSKVIKFAGSKEQCDYSRKLISEASCLNYHFEKARMEAKYPGVIEKLQKKYTKLSDFY